MRLVLGDRHAALCKQPHPQDPKTKAQTRCEGDPGEKVGKKVFCAVRTDPKIIPLLSIRRRGKTLQLLA